MTNLLSTAGIADWLASVFYGFCLLIDGIIYWFVALIYKVFYLVSQANLFGDNELKAITDRVYLILGVAMLFVFAYNVLILITSPDNLGGKDDKSLGSLAKNMVISIVILTLLPTIFNYIYQVQNSILSSNVIGNIILGGWSDVNKDYTISEAGTNMALTILTAFYHPVVNGEAMTKEGCDRLIASGDQGVNDICTEFVASYIQAQETSRLQALTTNGVLVDGINNGAMEYMYIISWVAGGFAVYLLLSFSIDVGIRVAKLSFFQIVAPVPVVLRITKPKGGTFDRWVSIMTKEFFSLFIRLAFIFFSMYVISLIPAVIKNLFSSTLSALSVSWLDQGIFVFLANGVSNVGTSYLESGLVVLLATVVLILGVLQFAKDGPKMVEDLMKMDHLSVNIKKKLDDNTYAMRGASAIGSGAAGFASNAWHAGGEVFGKNKSAGERTSGALRALPSMFGGAVGGARHGLKKSEGMSSWNQLGDRINQGRADSDEARNKRDERRQVGASWVGDDDNKVTPFIPGARGLLGGIKGAGKTLASVPGNVAAYLGGEVSDEALKAAKELQAAMERLTGGLEGLGGKVLNSLKEAEKQAIQDYYEGKFQPMYDAAGNPLPNPANPYGFTSIDDIKNHFKREKNQILREKAKDPVGLDIVNRTSETIVNQLEKSFAIMGKYSRDQIETATGKTLEEIGTQISSFSKDLKAERLTDTQIESFLGDFGKLAGAVGDQVTGINSAITEKKAQEKK